MRIATLSMTLALLAAGPIVASAQGQTQTLTVSQKDTQTLKRALVGHKVQPVEEKDAELNISVGAEVPGTVTLYPVPLDVVETAPALEAHDFFVVADGRIVIVDPATLRIVSIIRA
ncbi:MAG: DUF1236 domain-containing protein [Parvibaculaceae bacterium]